MSARIPLPSSSSPPLDQAVPSWPMIRALVGIGLICGLLIVLVYRYTLPLIQANQVEARQAAIFQVLPGAVDSQTFRLGEDGHFSPAPDDSQGDDLAFAGYDADGRLVGVALQGAGMGYQDVVKLLYGYSFEKQAIIGVKVLESRETPGLGTRIETDPDFLANFEALDARLDQGQQALANAIVVVKHGEKTQPWQVDAITGATISSTAVANILDDSASFWVPRLQASPHDFRRSD